MLKKVNPVHPWQLNVYEDECGLFLRHHQEGGFGGEIVRLAGPNRVETSYAVSLHNRLALFPRSPEYFSNTGAITEPRMHIVVNLRQEGAFAHVLAASMLAGTLGAVIVPVEDDGTAVAQASRDAVCGLDRPFVVIGGESLVAAGALPSLQAAARGEGCASG